MKTKENSIFISKSFIYGVRNPASIIYESRDFKQWRGDLIIKPMTPVHQKCFVEYKFMQMPTMMIWQEKRDDS